MLTHYPAPAAGRIHPSIFPRAGASPARAPRMAALRAMLALVFAGAELNELVIAQQPGIGYLNLMVMQEQKLIEKHAKLAGLGDVKVTWQAINSGQAMNEALNADKLHIAAGMAILSFSVKSARDLIFGFLVLSSSGMVLSEAIPL